MAKYNSIWTSALPEIFYRLDRSWYYRRDEKMHMPKEKFIEVGARYSSGYTAVLKISNGVLTNDVSGTIVAIDFYDVLTNDEHLRQWMLSKYLELRLDENFDLIINCKELDNEREDWNRIEINSMAATYAVKPDYSVSIQTKH